MTAWDFCKPSIEIVFMGDMQEEKSDKKFLTFQKTSD
jgi:hypothetical protein